MPLYWPKRVFASSTKPTPTSILLSGRVCFLISSSRSSAHAPVAASTAAANAVRRRSSLAPEGALIGRVARIVGAVDIGVAVHARAGERDADAGRGRAVRAAGDAGEAAAVTGRLVAALAEERRAGLEQAVVHRAVRVMADHAVFLDRLMGAHERPALLHVAGVAGLVDAVADQLLLAGAAVGVVAVGAGDLALERRVTRLAADLGALLLVAGEAHFGLVALVARAVVAGVDLVAAGAGDVARGMHAARPVDALAALVAGEAGLAARLGRRRRGLREHDVRLRPPALRRLVDVGFALAVAAGAGRRAVVGARAVLALADGEHREAVVLVVAARALRVAGEDEILRRLRLGLLLRDCAAREKGGKERGDKAPHRAIFSSFGPGPSGSVCAIPKWQSMQSVFAAAALLWRSRAVSLCFSAAILANSWQLRHSCELLPFIRVHSFTAIA